MFAEFTEFTVIEPDRSNLVGIKVQRDDWTGGNCNFIARTYYAILDFQRITEHRNKLVEAQEKERQRQNNNNNDSDSGKETGSSEKTNGKLFRSVLDELVDAGVSDDQIVDEVNTMLFGVINWLR